MGGRARKIKIHERDTKMTKNVAHGQYYSARKQAARPQGDEARAGRLGESRPEHGSRARLRAAGLRRLAADIGQGAPTCGSARYV